MSKSQYKRMKIAKSTDVLQKNLEKTRWKQLKVHQNKTKSTPPGQAHKMKGRKSKFKIVYPPVGGWK